MAEWAADGTRLAAPGACAVTEIVDPAEIVIAAIAIAAKWYKEIGMNPPGFEVHEKATTGGKRWLVIGTPCGETKISERN